MLRGPAWAVVAIAVNACTKDPATPSPALASTAPPIPVATEAGPTTVADAGEDFSIDGAAAPPQEKIDLAIRVRRCADICRRLSECRLYYFENKTLAECSRACEDDAREHYEDGVVPEQVGCMLEKKRACGQLKLCGSVHSAPLR